MAYSLLGDKQMPRRHRFTLIYRVAWRPIARAAAENTAVWPVPVAPGVPLGPARETLPTNPAPGTVGSVD
ncbi:MAG: hypothetical protein JSS27_01195 [Planctomycetes bacterium]|nr:hypothetical protein [Planctomycetota bacterium]